MIDQEQIKREILHITDANSRINGLILFGDAGWGKSYAVKTALDSLGYKSGTGYIYVGTTTSPIGLYKLIMAHKDKIIIIDDTAGVLEHKECVGILKSCLYGDSRARNIYWNKENKDLLDDETHFVFMGCIIICVNKIPNGIDNIALLSRLRKISFVLTYQEKLKIAEEIISQDDFMPDISIEKKKHIYCLIVEYGNPTLPHFNLREIEDLFFACKPCLGDEAKLLDYVKQECLNNLRFHIDTCVLTNHEMRLIHDLDNPNHSVAHQYEIYEQAYGKSKRTFQRKRKELQLKSCRYDRNW